jgi:hypothetical protein
MSAYWGSREPNHLSIAVWRGSLGGLVGINDNLAGALLGTQHTEILWVLPLSI